MYKSIFVLLGTVLVLLGSQPSLVMAAVSVSPLLIDHTAEARDMFEETITLQNPTETALRLFASVHEITLDEGGAIKTFVPPSMSDGSVSVTSWIAISRARIELAPGETKTIPVSFTMNPSVKPGLYHAFIGFGTGANRDEAEAATLAGKSQGAIVRIAVADKRESLLRLMRFTVDRFVTTGRASEVSYTLSNPGDLPLVPEGEVIFYNSRGEEVKSLTLNQDKQVIAPGETKAFAVALPPEGLFGKYKAFMTLEYGEGQRATVHDTTFFYAAPLSYLIGLFIALLFITMTLLFLLRKRIMGNDPAEDHDGYVAMYVRKEWVSDEKDHDINLRQNRTHD